MYLQNFKMYKKISVYECGRGPHYEHIYLPKSLGFFSSWMITSLFIISALAIFFNGKCFGEFLMFMQNINCPLILLISSLLTRVRSEMVINLCNNRDDVWSDVANICIVETLISTKSGDSNEWSSVCNTGWGNDRWFFNQNPSLLHRWCQRTRDIWFIMSGRDLECVPWPESQLCRHILCVLKHLS